MKYEVKFPTERILKEFNKILLKVHPKKLQNKIMHKVEELADNPRPEGKSFKVLKPPIELYQYTAQCRLRIGDYRVLYDIDENKKVIWVLVLRRRTEKTYR